MKRRVLVADDDASVRGALKRILEDADYEVLLADNGQQAVERFAPGEIDLLILDLDMPLKDGWETFENLMRKEPRVPVIIMTGLPNQRPILLPAGVGALFEKPIEVPVLLDTIKQLLAEPSEQRSRRLCGDSQDSYLSGASAGLFEGRLRVRAETPLRICGSSSGAQGLKQLDITERRQMHMTAIKTIKRIAIGVAGSTVLALGVALIVLPGPAFLVIPAGLAILAIEFAWARRWLRSARAVLPRAAGGTAPRRPITMGSVWRSGGFLLRQVRRTLLPKRKVT